MIDLPPSLPVVTECASAVVESWQAAEACIVELGYTRSDRKDYWAQIEIDYWAAIKLSSRDYKMSEVDQQAETDMVTALESAGLQVLPDDLPFLTMDIKFGNYVDPSEVNRLYVKGREAAVVLLNGPSSTSIHTFSSQAWDDFDQFWRSSQNQFLYDLDKLPVRRLDTGLLACWTENEKIHVQYDEANCAALVSLDILHTNNSTFEKFLGLQSDFSFQASFRTIRE